MNSRQLTWGRKESPRPSWHMWSNSKIPESFLKINILKNQTCLANQFLCKTHRVVLLVTWTLKSGEQLHLVRFQEVEMGNAVMNIRAIKTCKVRKVFGGTFNSYAVKIKDQIRYEKTESSTQWKDFEWQPRDEAAFLFRINGGCHWGHVLKWRKGNEF